VLNRLNFDPNLDLDDHVVGYEDRHAGAMEKAAGSWVTDSTDDDFIPQSRILYFKTKSDGVVVWDRKSRKNLVLTSPK